MLKFWGHPLSEDVKWLDLSLVKLSSTNGSTEPHSYCKHLQNLLSVVYYFRASGKTSGQFVDMTLVNSLVTTS